MPIRCNLPSHTCIDLPLWEMRAIPPPSQQMRAFGCLPASMCSGTVVLNLPAWLLWMAAGTLRWAALCRAKCWMASKRRPPGPLSSQTLQ